MKLSIPLGVEILRKIIGTSQCFHLCKQPWNCYFKGWGRGGEHLPVISSSKNISWCAAKQNRATQSSVCAQRLEVNKKMQCLSLEALDYWKYCIT